MGRGGRGEGGGQARAGFFGEPGQPAVPCTAGSYCPEEATQPTTCPAHTVSPPGSGQLDDCQAKTCPHAPLSGSRSATQSLP